MDFIKSKLSAIGTLMIVFGIVSAALSFFNYNLKVLIWVDIWGVAIGWIIRGILIIGGAGLFLLFNKSEDEEA